MRQAALPTKLAKDQERIVNKLLTLPVVITCRVVTYKRIGITLIIKGQTDRLKI
jgi:hypothetical protein